MFPIFFLEDFFNYSGEFIVLCKFKKSLINYTLKTVMGIPMGTAMNPYNALGNAATLIMSILLTLDQGMLPFPHV